MIRLKAREGWRSVFFNIDDRHDDVDSVLFLDPKMPTINESSPRKPDLAVYEKPGPIRAMWPDRGGAIRLTVAL